MSASLAPISVAETGTPIIVTNEGNGDHADLPRVRRACLIEKIVPTLRTPRRSCVCWRPATGQDMSVYDAVDRSAAAG